MVECDGIEPPMTQGSSGLQPDAFPVCQHSITCNTNIVLQLRFNVNNYFKIFWTALLESNQHNMFCRHAPEPFGQEQKIREWRPTVRRFNSGPCGVRLVGTRTRISTLLVLQNMEQDNWIEQL